MPRVVFENGEPKTTPMRLSDLRGDKHVVLIFVSSAYEAPFELLMSRIADDAKLYTKQEVEFVVVTPAPLEECIKRKKERRIAGIIAPDQQGATATSYGVPEGMSLDEWKSGKQSRMDIVLIDKAGNCRFSRPDFDPELDYEYVAYRILLLNRSPDDPVVKRVESPAKPSPSKTAQGTASTKKKSEKKKPASQ